MAKQKTRGEDELELSGAANTLKHLVQYVEHSQSRLNDATKAMDQALLNQASKPAELDGEDFDKAVTKARQEKKDAEDSFIKFSKVLLDYDKNVPMSRRDASESITRSDAEKFFFAFAICMRGATEQLIVRQCQDAMEVKSPEDMFKIISPLLRECYFSALKSATEESQMPKWVNEAIDRAL